MKKNIFSVIITVLTVVNVVLTAIMFFVMVPTFNKTNNLITQVASVLNLELDGDSDASADADYSMKDLEDTPVTFDSQQTINLKTGADGSQHYAMISGYTISVNKKADDYKDFGTDAVTAKSSVYTDIIRSVIQSHTEDDISEDIVKKEALEQIQKKFDTKAIVGITLTNFMFKFFILSKNLFCILVKMCYDYYGL